MKESIWMRLRRKINSSIRLDITFLYNLPQNLRWYNPTFTKFEEDIDNLRDRYPNTAILIM
jgi:Holliday junction resolvase RusA-like endonuclease